MREILFRGKRIDNGEWVQGYLFDDGFENGRMFVGGLVVEKYTGTACDDWTVTGINFYEIDPNTICQYTGLTDKNGKKIWENDILSGYLDDDFPEAETRVLVLWQENGWCAKQLECNGYEKLDVWYSEYFEVIGNVVDNPKLLEV